MNLRTRLAAQVKAKQVSMEDVAERAGFFGNDEAGNGAHQWEL